MKVETLELPEQGAYKGLVFDLDGTLVDSMPAHYKAWGKALALHGASGALSEDAFYTMGGKPTTDIVAELNEKLDLSLDSGAFSVSKRAAFLEELESVEVIDAVVNFAEKNKGVVPMAVATGGTRAIAEKTLHLLGLHGLFKAVITADDVTNGKPAPEVFLLAAERIGIPPQECVAFEDAVPGVMAATAAGMRVISVPKPTRKVS